MTGPVPAARPAGSDPAATVAGPIATGSIATGSIATGSIATEDPQDVRLALGATGLLAVWNQADVLTAADVHVANRLGELAGESDERVRLAVALAVRAVRGGSVCLDLSQAHRIDPTLPWPEPTAWVASVRTSPLVGPGRPLRWDLDLLYLDRYWRQEDQVRADLVARATAPPPVVDAELLQRSVDRLFPAGSERSAGAERSAAGQQRLAAEVAAGRWTTVLGGGPGTGKTTTVAGVLAVLVEQSGPGLRIALAAPTGKAAARLQEAVQQVSSTFDPADQDRLGPLTASTLHRLLGSRPGQNTRFKHDRDNRLPHDVIVVDETSMLSLTLMSRLLEAVRPDARLILVGDPDQLASIEAGAVLADLVAGLTGAGPDTSRAAARHRDTAARGVVVLEHTWRFSGGIAKLAAAIRDGDAARALEVLSENSAQAEPVVVRHDPPGGQRPEPESGVRHDTVAAATAIREAALRGDADAALRRLDAHRVLCAHRTGPYGVDAWSRQIESWLSVVHRQPHEGEWYIGRPLLVTVNDYALGLFNGDTGVVVREPDGSVRAVFRRGSSLVGHATSRLATVQTVHAMTVHRSQGSQFDRVTVVLPPVDSPLATREMLYTAVTRARQLVRLIGTEAELVAAIDRPAARASGLRQRLSGTYTGR